MTYWENLGLFNREQLTRLCRRLGVTGYSRLKKADIVVQLAAVMLGEDRWEKIRLLRQACRGVATVSKQDLFRHYGRLYELGLAAWTSSGQLVIPEDAAAAFMRADTPDFVRRHERCTASWTIAWP